MENMKSNVSVVPNVNSLHEGIGISTERSEEIRKWVGTTCQNNAGIPDEQATTIAAVHNQFEDSSECAYALSIINLTGTGCEINPEFRVPEAVAQPTNSGL